VPTLFDAAVAGLADKLRVGRVRWRVRSGYVEDLFERPETSTLDYLRSAGFSDRIVSRFFRPFLGGIFLERELATTSRQFEFVFRMFASGDTALPAEGIGAIPRQLADGLPAGAVRLNTPVTAAGPDHVTTADGERLSARSVVVATDGPTAARLAGGPFIDPGSRSVTCVYFAADKSPTDEAILMLNGDGEEGGDGGPVNNLCVPSAVAPSYAPPGAALVSASVLGLPPGDDAAVEAAVRSQLSRWFGEGTVRAWRHLRTYRIAHAQPHATQLPPTSTPAPLRKVPWLPWVCGDFTENPSLNGALLSGRHTAEAVIEQLGVGLPPR
jgi:phytoene dehydrogenase-like protein